MTSGPMGMRRGARQVQALIWPYLSAELRQRLPLQQHGPLPRQQAGQCPQQRP